MPQSKELARLSAVIRDRYAASWGRIVVEEERLLADWTALRRAERLARLREMRATVEQLMDQADELALRFTTRDLPKAYHLGAQTAAHTVGRAVNYTLVDVDAVNELAVGTHQELLQATRFVKRSTKDLIRRLSTDHLADKLIRGLTAEQAARNLRRELEGHGITSVVYKDGSRHGLADYTDMLARTRTGEAYQVGGFNQSAAQGITFMEIFDGFDCGLTTHDDTRKANGLILPLEEARSYPLAHPRCGRSTSPRPDIVTARDAETAEPSTTAEQRADQEQVERGRAQTVADRAAAKRFEKQIARRADGILSDAGNRVTSPAAARAMARREARARRAARSA